MNDNVLKLITDSRTPIIKHLENNIEHQMLWDLVIYSHTRIFFCNSVSWKIEEELLKCQK
jgi:hypothetical protein